MRSCSFASYALGEIASHVRDAIALGIAQCPIIRSISQWGIESVHVAASDRHRKGRVSYANHRIPQAN
jgi:hypothetical protein